MNFYKFGYFIIFSILISACSLSSNSKNSVNENTTDFIPKFKVRYYGTNFSHKFADCDRFVFNDIQFQDRTLESWNFAKFSAMNSDGTTNSGNIYANAYGFTTKDKYMGGVTPYLDLSATILPKDYSVKNGGIVKLAFILANNMAPTLPGMFARIWGWAWTDINLPPNLTPDDVALFTIYTDHKDNAGRRPDPPIKAVYDGLEADFNPPPKFKIRYYGTNFSHVISAHPEYVFNDIQFLDRNVPASEYVRISAMNSDGTTNSGIINRNEYGFTVKDKYMGGSTPYFDLSPTITPQIYSFKKGGVVKLSIWIANNLAPPVHGFMAHIWSGWVDVDLPPNLTPDDTALFTIYIDDQNTTGVSPKPVIKAIYDGLE